MESRHLGVMAICGLVVVVLCGPIGVRTEAADRQNGDILVRLFGGTAEIASRSALDQADLYLHKGAGHLCEDHGHDGDQQRSHSLPMQGLVRRLHGQTAPRDHSHVVGSDEKELLPWFVIAARLDPRNVEAWRTGAYWYYRTGQVREAERFISAGIASNPSDHRVYLERGILYHRLERWNESASDLRTAMRLYRSLDEDSPFELKAARIYLRDCAERLRK
ncbi:MAG: hypothetical protein KBC96_02825 [Armatimonadetes bacterium]|nr:hypothetical protein [Armatimonadota bacterium]